MIGQLSEGFMLGLATGATCLATCGPVYAPFLMQSQHSWKKSVRVVLELSIGRFISYLLIGALAGASGSAVADEYRTWFTISAYLLFSTFLIISAVRTRRKERCCRVGRWYSFSEKPFLLGILTGINICPPFLIALTRSFDVAGPVAGMLFFTAFFAGTTIFLIPLAAFGMAGNRALFRRIARAAAILVGIWFILQAVAMAYHQFDAWRSAAADTRPIVNIMDSTVATVIVRDRHRLSPGLAALLKERRGGYQVWSDTLPPRLGYIFIEHDLAEETAAVSTLRGPGRFVCILPGFADDSAAAVEKGRSIAQFLKFYDFRFDADSGTVYWVPENAGVE